MVQNRTVACNDLNDALLQFPEALGVVVLSRS